MSDKPKFKKKGVVVDKELSDLGIALSKDLPTYDVPIDLIEPNEKNPNEMDDGTFNRLVEEMEKTGIVSPIQIAPSKGGRFKIIGGEHRWRGAQVLGRDTIPCNILTGEQFADEDLRDFLMVRLNVIAGRMDRDKFLRLYEEKVREYGKDQLQALFGYTSTDAWKKLTKGMEDSLKASGIASGGAIAAELNKRAKRVRSIDGLSGIVNSLMKEFGSDLKNGFMFFVYGGKRHLYVVMDKTLVETTNRLVGYCRKESVNIGEALHDAISLWLRDKSRESDGAKGK